MTEHRICEYRALLPLSIGAVCVLALSACGSPAGGGEDSDAAEEQNAEASVEEAPALSEIEDTMWDSMLEAESVSLTGDGFDPEDSLSELEELDIDPTEFTISGALDDSGAAVSFGEEGEAMLAFGETAYVDVAMTFSAVEDVFGDLFGDELDLDDVRDEIDGLWLEFTEGSGEGDDALVIESLLEELREGWDSSEAGDLEGVSRESLSEEGSHEVRDGDDVWVYDVEDGEGEVVLSADHEAPYMLEAGDGEQSVIFSEWNEAEIPERPASEEIITEAELEELLTEEAMDQM